MALPNDNRDRGDIERALSYYDTVLPVYYRRVADTQRRLDELLRERDHALERLWVLNHEYQEATK